MHADENLMAIDVRVNGTFRQVKSEYHKGGCSLSNSSVCSRVQGLSRKCTQLYGLISYGFIPAFHAVYQEFVQFGKAFHISLGTIWWGEESGQVEQRSQNGLRSKKASMSKEEGKRGEREAGRQINNLLSMYQVPNMYSILLQIPSHLVLIPSLKFRELSIYSRSQGHKATKLDYKAKSVTQKSMHFS